MISTSLDDLAKELRATENKLERVKSVIGGWTRGNEANPSFDFLRADSATFYYPPLESARWARTSVNQGISNNTWVRVEFSTETWNFGPVQHSTLTPGVFSYRHLEALAELMFT